MKSEAPIEQKVAERRLAFAQRADRSKLVVNTLRRVVFIVGGLAILRGFRRLVISSSSNNSSFNFPENDSKE